MSTFTMLGERELRVLTRLLSPEMRPFVDMLDAELAATHAALVRVPDAERMRQLQGKGQLLSDLLLAIRSAPEMLSRTK
jgi:hypothetical protein